MLALCPIFGNQNNPHLQFLDNHEAERYHVKRLEYCVITSLLKFRLHLTSVLHFDLQWLLHALLKLKIKNTHHFLRYNEYIALMIHFAR